MSRNGWQWPLMPGEWGEKWEFRLIPQLIGEFERPLDHAGRLVLPPDFRHKLGDVAVLSQERDGCLALRTSERFAVWTEEILAGDATAAGRNRLRYLARYSRDAKIDSHGRVAVPEAYRRFARVEERGPVLVVGAVDRVELWNPSRWNEIIGDPESRKLFDGVDVSST
ncbi:MAG: hypothetical protein M0020_07870 [Actinomycetota bacterium]|nr:hypothetical protein [Actinomycetota bacterium]